MQRELDMSEITKVEQTIILHATQSIAEMKSYAKDDMLDEAIQALHASSALIELGMAADGGLSAQAIKELNDLHKEQVQILNSLKKRGPAAPSELDVMALNGRNLASLSDDEQVVYDYFKAHGRQCGVRLAQVVKPVFLSFELSADHGMTDEQISVLTDRTSTIISVDIEKSPRRERLIYAL